MKIELASLLNFMQVISYIGEKYKEMDTVLNIVISGIAFFIGSYFLTGVTMKSFWQALVVAVLVAVLDLTLGNVLRIATLGILSLSIFTWFLNAILIQVADFFLPGFKVKNFWWALGLAGVVSVVSGLVSTMF